MDNQFNYRYVAPSEEERREIESIRDQYFPKEKVESKLERLRKLDFLVKNTAMIIALCIGVIGALLFGLGLAMILEWNYLIAGIILGVVGAVPIGLAYPVYRKVLKHNKEKYGEEILSLSNELLGEED